MKKTNVKVSSIVEYQLPEFVRVEYPLLSEFLKEYYRYTETNFGPSDILSNINDYIKIDSLSNIADIFYLYNPTYTIETILKDSTTILNNDSVVKITTKENHNLIDGDSVDIVPKSSISSQVADLIDLKTYGFNGRRFFVTVINEKEFYLNDSTVGISPKNISDIEGIGIILKSNITTDQDQIIIYSKENNKKSLPLKYGLLQINNEIILFKDFDDNISTINVDGEQYLGIKLLGCSRGFSGTTSLGKDIEDQLIFEDTLAKEHFIRSEVLNLNSIFLKKFLQKIKYQFLPGFENRDLNPDLNESIFIKQSKDFYSSKGTENSFKILFSVLYGEKVSVITPRDFLIEPSDAEFKVLRNLVVQTIEGDPENLLNRTLYQDDVGFIKNARGTVSFVERIERSGRVYYVVSIDDGYERDINFRGTLFSSFSIHPKTYSIETIFTGSTTIEVDSTVSFPNSGNLVVHTTDPETRAELIYNISYQSKTLNQFLGCKTIGSIVDSIRDTIYPNSEIFTDTYAYGFAGEGSDNIIKVRISGVLSDFVQNEQTYLYESGNKIRVRSLGEESIIKKDNNWIFNIPITYDIDTAFIEDNLDNSYRLTFVDEHNFHKSDSFYIEQRPDVTIFVKNVLTKNSIVARFSEPVGTPDLAGRVFQLEGYSITRLLSKGLFDNYPDLSIYNSNVQNTYLDKNKSLYVASPSLPSYSDLSGGPTPLDIRDGSVSGKFLFGKSSSVENNEFVRIDKLYTDGTVDYSYFTMYREDSNQNLIPIEHGFYTGDEVVFRSLDLQNLPFNDGIYFVKEFRSDGDLFGIKLSSSRSNILNEKYITPEIIPPSTIPSVTQANCTIQYYEFSIIDSNSPDNFNPQLIGPQNIIRKIDSPIQDTVKYDTKPGTTGIFLNGVEILNYKSKDNVFYGPIEKVDVIASGSGYDVINPPEFLLEDSGGAIIKFNSKNSIPLNYDGLSIKFGSVDGNIITYDGQGGEEIIISGKNLLLGTKKLYINQTGGSTLRINGLLVTVGGSGGTILSLGGQGGSDVRIFDDLLTLGTVGSGCQIYPSIIGKLEKINIIYQGFNYIGTPKITIQGGGGSGALAEPIMESFEYKAPFLPSIGTMNIDSNTIGFATYHNFENYEEVIYISGISTTIYGLEDRSRYIVFVEDAYNVKLYKSKEDAFVGISTVDIKAYSTGIHFLKSSKNKSKIGSVNIISSGSGYKNKKVSTIPNKINLVTNVIGIENHGYSSGDLIIHYSSGQTIGGITSNTPYYVTKIDEDNIKLSEIYNDQEIFEAPQDFLYTTKQYVNITNVGSGIHYFNYTPITVTVEGFIGVSTSAGQDLNAKLQPVFRGEIDSIFVANNGSGYGSFDIIDYSKQPILNVVKGENAQIIPIISNVNGSIEEVLIINSGKNYISVPDLIVRGDGNGAVLTPIIKNGKIERIEVIYRGLGYKKETTLIEVIDRGEGVKISTQIKPWKVNLLSRFRLTNRETADSGFVYSGINSRYGLQYSHIYLPDKLREILYNDYSQDGSTYADILSDTSEKRHSPIVGWAYDGNPIYGPYGYENGQSGQITALKSGYSLVEGLERVDGPPISLYPKGFFIEDYVYKQTNNGNLDENNGRFCKTPEFPNGTYAYFCTIDTTQILVEGRGYPASFPYVIGDQYKSKPIEFNFDPTSNQDDIDINKTGWYRNTTPYNINNKNFSRYQYLLVPNKIKDPISQVKYASYGEVESVDIIVEGQNYKVADKIKFKNSDVIGQDATAEVTDIGGVEVRSVSIARSTFENVEFVKFGNGTELIGFTTQPHGYTSGDIVSISTPIERIVFKDINFFNNNLFLTKEVKLSSQTGIITYFEVSGDLTFESIREDDVYYVVDPASPTNNREEIKILNIDKENQIIRVSRGTNGYVGLATYPIGTRFTEKSRKFNANLGIQTYYNFNPNYSYYFDAEEVVGLGTSYGTGITSTIYFNYSKVGISSLSIPTKSIYLKNHGFETNQELKYSGSSSIIVSKNGLSQNTFALSQNSIVYPIKINNDLIGLSTSRVGISSTGSIIDLNSGLDPLLYFHSAFGNNHKLSTLNNNVLRAKVSQSIVTVSTSSTHGLLDGDIIEISVKPLNTKTIAIEYNDESRTLLANKKDFLISNVNISENLFTITNHQYQTGDKILYKSISPIVGLVDNEIYFIVVIDRNTFGLTDSLFESKKPFPKFISIGSATNGSFYQINPEIKVIKGQTIIFDLSSETLSFTQGSSPQRIPAFNFHLFEDSNFNHEYISSGLSKTFDVSVSGTVGSPNAKLTLKVSDSMPDTLYYKLSPLNVNGIPNEKSQLFIDFEQSNNNKITTIKSKYDGTYSIFDPIERDSTLPPFEYSEFKYQIPRDPESEEYDLENSEIKYITNSKNAFGPIVKCSVKNKGRYFYRLPKETIINSSTGNGAIVSANSKNIGQIKSVNIKDIGFDYPSDLSIRAIAKLPTIYKVEPLYSIKSILITSNGVNYLTPPNIDVIDAKTKLVINDLVLRYNLGDNFVTIVRNTKNLSNVIPRLVPVNNSNGIPLLLNQGSPIVLNVSNNSEPEEVQLASDFSDLDLEDPNIDTLYSNLLDASPTRVQSLPFSSLVTIQLFLKSEYSSIVDFPFLLGDFVFIEDVITIEETNGGTSNGYNSSSNGYAFYKIVKIDPNIGGAGASITLDFSGFIPESDLETATENNKYIVDEILSEAARVIPVKYFPAYLVTLEKNDFITDEELITQSGISIGIVEQWDSSNDYLKISEKITFNEGDTVIGQTSKTKAILLKKIEFDAGYSIRDSSIVTKGWDLDTGKLNFDLQRIHDNDYYQYFSYALKSKVSIDKWNDDVGSLNHTSGFKRFSELEIETNPLNYSGISTSQNSGVSFGINDLISEVSVNCVYDFDLVREITFGNPLKSNEIIFNSRILQDYIESISNRVLSIDDISKNFNALPRETNFSVVARSDSTEIRTKKTFFYIQDRRFFDDRQMLILTTVHDDENVFLGQYGRLETNYDMAYFESNIIGNQQNLLFYPSRDEINNFLVDFVVFELTDDLADLEELSFGDIAYTYNQVGVITAGTNQGVGTTVVGIGSTFRSSKILFQVGNEDKNYFEVNEITLMHDDNGNVLLSEFGEITTSTFENESVVGICSYSAQMSPDGTTVDLIMTPYNNLTENYDIKTITTSVSNETFNTIGSLAFETGQVTSFTQSGISTEIPSAIEVTQYSAQYKCAYIFASMIGIQTGLVTPYDLGDRNHGISDWYAFENGTVTYSAIYPDTEIFEVTPEGYITNIVTTSSTDPERGSIGITSGYRYYGSKAINLFANQNQHIIAPVSFAGTTFGHYPADRGFTPGITTFFIYSPFESTEVRMYEGSPDGILGIASTSITVGQFNSGIHTTSILDDWVFFDSDYPVIMTVLGPGGTSGNDKAILSPSITGIGSTNYRYYPNSLIVPSTERFRTAYNNFPVGITTIGVYDTEPIIGIRQSDGAGADLVQAILLDHISDTYSWGDTLSDYVIAAPYPSTIVNVSYWNGTNWVLGESHNLTGGTFEQPIVAQRDGNSGFNVWGNVADGSASNLAATLGSGGSDPDLWKFESNQPFVLIVNDTSNDEEVVLGFTSSLSARPINKEYKSTEIQMIGNSVNSYISEYGIVRSTPPAGIGTIGIGSFSTKLVGGNVKLMFTPSPLIEFNINGFQINVGRF